MESLKQKVPELTKRIAELESSNDQLKQLNKDSDNTCNQLRNDMQRLNDLYTAERDEHIEIRNNGLRLEQDLIRVQQEVVFYQRESQKNQDLRKKNQNLISTMTSTQKQLEESKNIYQNDKINLEKKLSELEKEKIATTSHFWNLTEEIKNYKIKIDENTENEAKLLDRIDVINTKAKQSNDRELMVMEDQLAHRYIYYFHLTNTISI